jgi:hypothetical protein
LTCKWDEIRLYDYLRKFNNVSLFELLTDYTHQLFNDLRERMENEGNAYIVLSGLLNSGKSWNAIYIAKKLSDIQGSEFTINHIVTDLKQFANLLKKYKRNFTCVFEEAQNFVGTDVWMEIPKELKDVITSQRKLQINIVYTSILPEKLYFGVRQVLNYLIEMRYKNCKEHAHGYVYQVDTVMLKLQGSFRGCITIPLSWLKRDEECWNILQEYEKRIKSPYMEARQESFTAGGDYRIIAENFIKYCSENNILVEKKMLQAYLDQNLINVGRTKLDRIWAMVCFLIETGEAQKIVGRKFEPAKPKRKKVRVAI